MLCVAYLLSDAPLLCIPPLLVSYGDMPAHNLLWKDCQKSAASIEDRMAIIPMVQVRCALMPLKMTIIRVVQVRCGAASPSSSGRTTATRGLFSQ